MVVLATDAAKDVSRNRAIRKETLGPHIKRKGNNQKIKRNKNTLRGKRKLIDRWLKIRRIRLKRKLKKGRKDGLKKRGSCLALTCVDTAVDYLRLWKDKVTNYERQSRRISKQSKTLGNNKYMLIKLTHLYKIRLKIWKEWSF